MSVLNRKKKQNKIVLSLLSLALACSLRCNFTRYRGRLRRDKIRVFTGICTMPFELLIRLDYAVWSSNFNRAVFLFKI